MRSLALVRLLALLGFVSAATSPAQIPLAGDDAQLPAAGGSRYASIAAGSSGYLVVWEDSRAAIGEMIAAGGEPLLGNQMDIYARRLDAQGQPLDPHPIVVCNLPRHQTRPKVAWNGTSWLVVFTSERPDWYFFEDIVGVRVDASGAVLDAQPISLRPEQSSPSNYYGVNPEVGSDGVNWVAIWEDWNPTNFRPNVRGVRIAPSGQVLDPTWVTLYEHNGTSFGPRDPQISFAGGQYLLAWRDAATSSVLGRRISTALAPLAPAFTITSYSPIVRPRLCGDGSQHYLVSNDRLFRVSSGGAVLDPTGILVATPATTLESAVSAAWNGVSLSLVQSRSNAGRTEVFLRRVNAAGALLDPSPIAVTPAPSDYYAPVVAGLAGRTQITSVALDRPLTHLEDFRSIHVDAMGVASAPIDVDAGMARQQNVLAIAIPGGHVVTYLSKSSLATRLLAQRIDASGNAVDTAPVALASWHLGGWRRPAAAFDGAALLFGWTSDAGITYVQRYDLQLQALDPQPIQVFTGAYGSPSIAALPGQFLVVGTYRVSTDRSYLRGMRVRGSDSALLDATPFAIAGNFVVEGFAAAVGGRYCAYWTHAANHSTSVTTVEAAFVDANGLVHPVLPISTSYYAGYPVLAAQGSEALIAYHVGTHGEDGIRAQRLAAAGSTLGTEITICDAAMGQMFPAASPCGPDYAVVWSDYRAVQGIEQLRSDLWGARVRSDGVVLDPAAVQLTSTVLSEDLPALSSEGSTLLLYSGCDMRAGLVDVPRILLQPIDDLLSPSWTRVVAGSPGTQGMPTLAGYGELLPSAPFVIALAGARPSSAAVLIVGSSRLDLPLLGSSLVPWPEVSLPLAADASGRAELGAAWPTGIPRGLQLWYQAWQPDARGPGGLSSTNALASSSR